jgi:hypothetical protein
MNIALDYDNTFTRDPLFWQRLIDDAVASGHKVWLVTSRSPDDKVALPILGIEDAVYCNARAKRVVCNELGIPIDIWIDDDPLWINTHFVEDE